MSDLLIADCEDFENLPASDIHAKKFELLEVAQEGKHWCSGADGSPQTPRGEVPDKGNLEQDAKVVSKKTTVNTFGT